MNNRTLHPAIQHLSNTEIEALTAEYLAGAKVSPLMDRFNIKCAPTQFSRLLPPRVLAQSCAACGNPMVQDLPSRSYKNSSGKVHCSSCKHEEGDQCRCKHCKDAFYRLMAEEKARHEAAVLQAVTAERNRYLRSNYSVNNLPLSVAIAFLAFVECCPLNKNGLYDRLEISAVPFAPKGAYGEVLLTSLREAGLISVSEHSLPSAITVRGSDLVCELGLVYWTGDFDKNVQLAKDIERCALTGNWPEHWHGEMKENRLKVALAECREFFDLCAQERKLHPQNDRTITHTLENLLRDFSVAQCYRFILKGAGQASDFLQRANATRTHAGNYMAGACQRFGDTARAEGYRVKPLERNFKLPRSMVSYVLFNDILKIGERGFTDVILSPPQNESNEAW